MLDIAKSDYFAGSYPSAITGFEALLQHVPDQRGRRRSAVSARRDLLEQKRYAEAVNAYTAAIQNYPRSTWVPEAYYKRGKAQELLGTARRGARLVRTADQDLSRYAERGSRQAGTRSPGLKAATPPAMALRLSPVDRSRPRRS